MSNGIQAGTPVTADTVRDVARDASGSARDALRAFWRGTLSGAPVLLELPTDRPRPARQDHSEDTLDVTIDAARTARLKTFCERHGAGMQTALLAAWATTLARLSNQQTAVIACHPPEMHDTRAAAGAQGGDILPLRVDLGDGPTVAGLMRQVAQRMSQALDHRGLSFAQIAEAVSVSGEGRHAPLCQASLTWSEGDASHAGTSRAAPAGGEARFDLNLDLADHDGRVEGRFAFATALFDRTTAERILDCWRNCLDAMADADDLPAAALPILSDSEQSRILQLWNARVEDYPQPLCLHEAFEAQAARTPDAIALVCSGESLTYAELNRRANRIAHRLVAAGVKPDDLVAICMRRSNLVVEAILATLKAGAAYLPMDLVYPVDRLAYMLEDGAPKVVLTDGAGRDAMAAVFAAGTAEAPPLIELDDSAPAGDTPVCDGDDENIPVAAVGVAPHHLAYVIYTSGSTGKPKGVMIEHRHVGRLMDATHADYGFGPSDTWTLFHSYAFDFSVWEIWGALLYGGRLVVVPIETARSADAFHALLCAEGVTVLNHTPSAFRALIAAQQRSGSMHCLREVIFGGEALELRSLRPWYADPRNAGTRLVNMYGITETTVHVTFYPLSPQDAERENVSPIGVRIDDLTLYVLDGHMRPCPQGVIGELYVGGAGVARGYLNRPELTAERFVEDPFRPGERLYRSGDLARWLADGSIDYIGRNDFQVKIRGFRIELGEIESKLAACDGVREAVVLAREDTPGEKQLVAYYQSATTLPIDTFRSVLGAQLPVYMVPSAFVWMPEWPLTENGKLDRRALPPPDAAAYGRGDYEAPEGDVERELAAIWEELLRVEQIGRRDHFFEAGGHSLLAVQMSSRVRKALGVELTQEELFEAPVLSQLAERIATAERSELAMIPQVPRAPLMPLSLAQQRMWFLTQIDVASSAYHIYGALRLHGRLDADTLERALRAMIDRHEALRTRFVLVDGRPMQAIDNAPQLMLGRIDLREHDLHQHRFEQHDIEQRDAASAALGAAFFEMPFDLREQLPLRAQLLRLDDELYELQLTVHHIAADGWSMGVMYDEISRLYTAEVEGHAADLPALPVQYIDYGTWQRDWLSGGRLDSQAAYWRRTLTGAPPLLEMPTDRPRPAQQDFSGAGVPVRVEPELLARLKSLGRTHGATLYMTLLGSWALTLSRLAAQDEVVIGTPVAGRQRVEIESLIGFFVNTLALRVDLGGEPSVADLLAQVKRQVLGAQAHQDLPFDQVVEAVKPPRNAGQTPIFQAMLALQNQQEAQLAMPGIVAHEIVPATTSVQCDLLLNVSERDGALVGTLDYATALFDRVTAERFRDCWLQLLQAMAGNADGPAAALPMLADDERRLLLEDWNATAREYPRDASVHQVFETLAARTPDAPALSGDGGVLTYDALNRRANRIAHRLIAAGVKPGDRVAICMERSVAMVAGFLAILKSGAGYVPIDPNYPDERRAYLLRDCAPAAILAHAALRDADWLTAAGVPLLIDSDTDTGGDEHDPMVAGIDGRSLAYVIYTSGSTGEPKGVLVEHRNILRLVVNNTYAPLGEGDCIAHCSNPAFDASTWELWAALLNGARVAVIPGDVVLDPAALNRALIDCGATGLWLTVGLFNDYLDALAPAFSGLKHLLVGGDALDPRKVAQALRNPQRPQRIVNGYGPTESTTFAVTHHIATVTDEARSIPIGRPIANTRVYILDRYLQPVPRGVAGELYIGGDGVAHGYLNRPELTAERFLRDPFVADTDARMYRTGDVCRWLGDGTIEFIGRNDFQVKIRGFRIELGEIEARLAACPGVREAIVLARDDSGRSAGKRLVAYVIAENGDSGADAAELRAQLSGMLPDYMIPSAFVRMESWPLTENGKLDRRALPLPEDAAFAHTAYSAPQNAVEQQVADIWAELLNVERVGRDDNFFELGGHSLIAVGMVEKIRRRGYHVDVRGLFTAPTLRDFAASLDADRAASPLPAVPANGIPDGASHITPGMLPMVRLSQGEIDAVTARIDGGAANIQDIYPLSPLQEGMLFHSRREDIDDIYLVVQLLGFPSSRRLDAFIAALPAVIARHDILRTAFFWTGLNEPVQVVHRTVALDHAPLEFDPAGPSATRQLTAHFDPAHYRLDLGHAPLYRLRSMQDPADGRWLLAIGFHHLVIDHASLEMILQEAAAIAEGRIAGLPAPVPFRNYIWQARFNADNDAQHAFFSRMLGDIEQPTAPFGLAEMNESARDLDEHRVTLPDAVANELRRCARTQGVSIAALMHQAWAMVLARATGLERVVFGTVLFGRMDSGQDADRALGLFINTLPLRIDVDATGVAEALNRTQRALADLLHHEHASLAMAQRCSDIPAAVPLFTSIFNYRHSSGSDSALGDMVLDDETGAERTNFPLAMSVDDYGDRLMLSVQVLRHVGAERVCDYMRAAIDGLLEALGQSPATPVQSIDVMPAAEHARVVEDWNRTLRDYPRDLCVHAVFEANARRTPDAVALIQGDARVTYAELDARANRLARHLLAQGVGPGARIAICCERSVRMIEAVLASLKAGAAYLPLDPTYPRERLAYQLDDAEAMLLLADTAGRAAIGEPRGTVQARIVPLDDDAPWASCPAHPLSAAECPVDAAATAYMIYTSGSTGLPKGTLISHRSAVNLAHAECDLLGIDADSRVLQFASFAFDACVWEIFATFCAGAALVLPAPGTRLLEGGLIPLLRRDAATHATLPPALLNTLTIEDLPASLRLVVLAGEAPERAMIERLLQGAPGRRVINAYGPTEATVCATLHDCAAGENPRVVGKPLPNVRVYVLDTLGRPAPVGVAGELWIGGAGVAQGYWQRPELTAERFVTDPFAATDGARMYKTGDLSRWLPDGDIEFIGRNDFQVKIRGFRIELGEIEAQLAAFPGVRENVVLAREDHPGEKRLVAYVVADTGIDLIALRSMLSQSLPEYMVPAAFVRLDAIPLTPNGKVDRRALPAPDGGSYAGREYEAPREGTEAAVAALWCELLRVERVGRHDNFFELGGHSLIAVTMIERLRRDGLHGDIATLFASTGLSGFSAALRRETRDDAAPPSTIPEGAQRIEPHMLPLIDLPQEQIDAIAAMIEGGAGNIQDIYPLSPMQEGILFHRLLADHGDPYHATVLLYFPDRGAVDTFISVLQRVVDRHDALRTAFVWEGLATPVQVVQRRARIGHRHLELDAADGAIGDQLAAHHAPGAFALDITRAPPIHCGYAHDAASGEWVMCLVFHHLVMDHTSLEIMMQEASLIARGRESELPAPAPFRNYIWQLRRDADRGAHRAFFTRLLGDIDQPTAPFGLNRTADDLVDFDEYVQPLAADTAARVRLRARALGVSPAAVMHLAWALVLARATGLERVVFGTVLFGRMNSGEDADRALGPFINTLPLRVDLGATPVVDALRNTHAALLDLLPHEHAPLVDALRCSGVPASAPLFTSLLNYTYSTEAGSFRSDYRMTPTQGAERTNYPLAIAVDDAGEDFEIAVQVLPSVGARCVHGYLTHAIAAVVEALESAPHTPVSAIDAMPPGEYARIVHGWNQTTRPFPLERCAHALFSEQAARTPQATALVFGDDSLSYGELESRANRLAHALGAEGIAPGMLVALSLDRGIDMVVALLGVLKAGAAYVPMAPDAPEDRVVFMLEDSGAARLLADADVPLSPDLPAPVLRLQDLLQASASQPDTPPQSGEVSSSGLSYVIYTSGTTGQPKGVAVTHRNVVNFVYWCADADLIGPGHSMTQFAPYTFDASAGEIFAALLNGATLHLLDGATIQDPQRLQRYLCEHAIGFSALPPAYLQQLDPALAPPQFRLLTAGSAPTPELVRRWAGRGHYLNGYGPTETTILSTTTWLSADEDTISIGRPIANTRVYLLDDARRPVPAGTPGEIWIGGEGVTRGYLNRPELTDERYVDDPHAGEPGARMYRTGDLGRWIGDGDIEFLGRNDFQVKIRGFRIELGEIESGLCAFDGIREAVVVAREDGRGEPRLAAYYLSDAACDAAALRQFLAQTLPDYMMPAAFVHQPVWPLTANGKIDRKALPDPDDSAFARRAYTAPVGETETVLATLWESLLGVEGVGRDDHFFELGGHSLLAVQLASRVRQALGADMPLRALFEAPVLSELAARLVRGDGPALAPIPVVARDGALPLSPAQQRLWFLTRLDGVGAAYHMGGAVLLQGALDQTALAHALQRVVDRHEILRTAFVPGPDGPVQTIAAAATLQLETFDLSGTDNADAQAGQAWAEAFARPFDLAAGQPLRVQLLRMDAQTHRLHLVMHHIVSDGWSVGVLLRELAALYAAECEGGGDPLPPLPIQYADYAQWQRDALQSERADMLADYWRQALDGAPSVLTLPTDRPRPPMQSYAGALLHLEIGPEVTARLRALGLRHGATLYMTLLAAWAALLGRLAQQPEVVIGSPMAGRDRAEIEALIGFFVDTLTLRIDLDGSPSVAGLLARTRQCVLDAQAHRDLPFEQLVEAVKPPRSTAHTPVFQTMFTLNPQQAADLGMPGLTLSPIAVEADVAQFDIALDLDEDGDGLRGAISYATALFDAGTIRLLAGRFQQLLEAMAGDDSRAIDTLPILADDERQRLLQDWNDTARAYPHDECVHARIHAQATRTPDALALIDGETRTDLATLDRAANRLAHRLVEHGVGPEQRVLVCLERGADAIIALLAVLKAGGAYVPLDPNLPAERLAAVLEDCTPAAVLAPARLAQVFAGSAPVLDPRSEADTGTDAEASTPPVTAVGPGHAAYIIYTSGSTGTPKGVIIEHRALAARVDQAIAAYDLRVGDRCLQFSSLSFDASAMQIFPALASGAALVLRGDAPWSPEDTVAHIARHDVAIADIPPSYLPTLLEPDAQAAMRSLRLVVVGGEATPVDSLRGKRFAHAIVNEYGPTEATITATALRIEPGADVVAVGRYLPIGRPIANTRAYILDARQQPVPIGVEGELYIGGAGVARGYLNRPDLTAERFMHDPYAGQADARMYRTGDLCRWRSDGIIEYLGRNDAQVKIRGFRIEPGEIEAQLLALPAVRAAAVLPREHAQHGTRLVAYCLADANFDVAQVRQALSQHLPDYMLPAAFVRMDAWPVNASGKLDQDALPMPDKHAYAKATYEPPQGATEHAIAQAWSEALGISPVGRHDHFFDLGGHSVLLLRVLRTLQAQGIEIPVQTVYRLGTIAAIAAEIDGHAADPAEWLRLRGWAHAQARIGERNHLWLAPADDDARRAFGQVLARCAASVRPDRITLVEDPEAACNAALASAAGIAGHTPGSVSGDAARDARITALRSVLADRRKTLAAADEVDHLDFSATHRELLHWSTRDGLHVVPLPGWWSADALKGAFDAVVKAHDMLRVRVDAQANVMHVLDPAAFTADTVPHVDLRDLGDAAAAQALSQVEAALREMAGADLSYAAALVSRGDADHLLALYGDHIAWDGQSLESIGMAMTSALNGLPVVAAPAYRTFQAHAARARAPELLDQLASDLDADALVRTVQATTTALAARAGQPAQVLLARFPAADGQPPVEQAFAIFRRLVASLLGLERFGMVVTHHGRRLEDQDYFGRVGLFVDKIAVQVDAGTSFASASATIAGLNRRGVRFLDWERSGDARVAGALPAFADEISFNYQAAIATDWEAGAVGLAGMIGKMQATRGIICEFYADGDSLGMVFAYRGANKDVSEVKASIQSASGTLLDAASESAPSQPATLPQTSTVIAPAAPAQAAIVVRDLYKRYVDIDVVKGMSFSVPRGCCFGILGPNGAGKTSLLGMIEGIVPITSGSISVMGMDVATELRKIQPMVGVQLQYNNYFQFLTVAELLKFYTELRAAASGKPRHALKPPMQLLERLDLGDKLKFKVEELSGGQRQRLSIALALIADPQIVFLDEPTAALDPHSRRYTWEFIEELKQDRNRTIVLTTHYMEEAERLCDEIMIMNSGQIVGQGNPSGLIAELNASQQTRVRLEVGAPGNKIANALSPRYSAHWDGFNDTLVIASEDVVGALRDSIAQAEAHGATVLDIRVERLSLEDVFLNKTGKELKP